MTAPGVLTVDDAALGLPASVHPEETYDVLLNDQHVWSLVPARDAEPAPGHTSGPAPGPSGGAGGAEGAEGAGWSVPWPKALAKYLVGRAEVVVRRSGSQEEVARTRHVFAGREDAEVQVLGRHGEKLILDKWGRLIKPLAGDDASVVDLLLDEVEALLRFLSEDVGRPAFICYGTLLGAVRDGALIGHDNDVDLAYLSDHEDPVDVIREGFRVERRLREAGWQVRRGSGTRLNVRLRLGDGSFRFVDVFTAHWVSGVLFIPSDTGFRVPRSVILPLTTASLHGRPFPAPAESERLLALTYGPRWRVPDPGFKYTTPRWMSRRFGGWFGGLMARRKHWDSFYSQSARKVPARPSDFARWIGRAHPSDRLLVDVGSGTGRDALWFASQGRPALGVDYSVRGVNRARKRARARVLDAEFEVLNLYDLRAVLALGGRLAHDERPCDLLVRLTLNGLDEDGRENVARLAAMTLRRGGHLFVEFRTDQDKDRPHLFPGHGRLFLPPAEVRSLLEEHGLVVVHEEQGTGLAPLRGEDPHVCRMVARWGR